LIRGLDRERMHMEFIRPDININFMKRRVVAIGLSGLLIVVGIGLIVARGGPRYGIDFAGGLLVQVRFQAPTTSGDIKAALEEKGLPRPMVQHAWELGEKGSHEYIIRTDLGEGVPEDLTKKVQEALEERFGSGALQIRRVEMVGPKVGKDLRSKGIKSMVFALLGILIYISWRFQLKFAFGAVIALVHDVLLTLGAFALTNKEINLPIIAALLAIIGYSLNDTIVVYDRIREDLRKYRRQGYDQIINRSINETLSRTLLTSGTTLIVVVALFLFGGGVIHDFAFALLVGIVVGTYSSIFIASPIVLFWQEHFGTRRPKPAKIM
jgi:preprotein translocase subunit SecF